MDIKAQLKELGFKAVVKNNYSVFESNEEKEIRLKKEDLAYKYFEGVSV